MIVILVLVVNFRRQAIDLYENRWRVYDQKLPWSGSRAQKNRLILMSRLTGSCRLTILDAIKLLISTILN